AAATDGMITGSVVTSRELLNSLFLLAGATTIKGQFARPLAATKKCELFYAGGKEVAVKFLSGPGSRYAETDGLQAVELPLKAGAGYLLLVASATDKEDVVTALGTSPLKKLAKLTGSKFKIANVLVKVPLITRIDSTNDLIPALKASNITRPFQTTRNGYRSM